MTVVLVCYDVLILVQGRVVSVVKYPGMHADSLNSQTVSVCCDTVAIRDKKEEKGRLMSALPLLLTQRQQV